MPDRGSGAKVRVVLPMLSLVPGGMGGTETYATELMSGLRDDPLVDVSALLPANAGDFLPRDSATVVASVRTGPAAHQRLAGMARAVVAREARRAIHDADVVHYPFTVPAPPTKGRPHVVSLHDVQHLVMPEFFSAPERAYRRLSYERAARSANRVVTVSAYCRGQISSRLGIPEARIRVVHLGVADDFTPTRGGREEFVLYPARRWPHKNHERLLAAMELVRQHRPGMRLVLTGGGVPLVGAPAWVEQRGLIPRGELMSLYSRASALVFPSLYEGFGLPPLEAMASGCPVAVSNVASLPEVCGDAAVYFDPTDVTAMARGIEQAITSGDAMIDRGVARASSFSWRRCAAAHRDLYLELAGR